MAIDIQSQKAKLEKELEAVTAELATLGIHNPEVPEDWITTPGETRTEADPNVVADRVEEWDERAATLTVLETRYNNIRHALKKIDAGNYGICEVGGEPIDEERLAVAPAARTCVAHAEAASPLNP